MKNIRIVLESVSILGDTRYKITSMTNIVNVALDGPIGSAGKVGSFLSEAQVQGLFDDKFADIIINLPGDR